MLCAIPSYYTFVFEQGVGTVLLNYVLHKTTEVAGVEISHSVFVKQPFIQASVLNSCNLQRDLLLLVQCVSLKYSISQVLLKDL